MTPSLSLLATTSSGTAKAHAVTSGSLPEKETLRAERKAVDDQKLKNIDVRKRVPRQHTS